MATVGTGEGLGAPSPFTRGGYDWTDRYQPVSKACGSLASRSALIDGEIIVEDEDGVSEFDALQSAIRYQPHRLVFFAFDLLHLDGEDLRRKPLIDRRAKLARIIEPGSRSCYSEHFEGDAFFAAAAALEIRGSLQEG
jgi:bifunctional non-homologous end joining protein LigD